MESKDKTQPLPNSSSNFNLKLDKTLKKSADQYNVQPNEKPNDPEPICPPSHKHQNCDACIFWEGQYGNSGKLKMLEKWSLDPTIVPHPLHPDRFEDKIYKFKSMRAVYMINCAQKAKRIDELYDENEHLRKRLKASEAENQRWRALFKGNNMNNTPSTSPSDPSCDLPGPSTSRSNFSDNIPSPNTSHSPSPSTSPCPSPGPSLGPIPIPSSGPEAGPSSGPSPRPKPGPRPRSRPVPIAALKTRQRLPEPENNPDSKDAPHQCPKCHLMLKNLMSYKKHMQRCDRKFVCSECNVEMAWSSRDYHLKNVCPST